MSYFICRRSFTLVFFLGREKTRKTVINPSGREGIAPEEGFPLSPVDRPRQVRGGETLSEP